MRTWVTGLLVSMLWVSPIMIEVGTAGTTGEQAPEQKQIISKDDFKLIQERLKAEGVYAGPVDGEVNAQTEAALRAYQQKRGIPVSGAADEATIRELQLRLPASRQGEGAP
jgi:peptidoglycan hydrolase-like protein with peptidoglycan-binding domain